MTQNACDKTNTLTKMKHYTEYTMICIRYFVWGYSTRNKHRNSEINPTQRNFERKPTTVNRKKWDSTMNNVTVIYRKQQEQDKWVNVCKTVFKF